MTGNLWLNSLMSHKNNPQNRAPDLISSDSREYLIINNSILSYASEDWFGTGYPGKRSWNGTAGGFGMSTIDYFGLNLTNIMECVQTYIQYQKMVKCLQDGIFLDEPLIGIGPRKILTTNPICSRPKYSQSEKTLGR